MVDLIISVLRPVDTAHLGRVPKESLKPDVVCMCMKIEIPHLESLNNLDKKTKYNSNIRMR